MGSEGLAGNVGSQPVSVAEQGVLFEADTPLVDTEVGFRGPDAQRAVGITYRQLDYWARSNLVKPTVRPASGSGTQRLYSFRDVLVLKVVKRLLDTGVSLRQIRKAVEYLAELGVDELSSVTLMSDGASIYMCTTNDEVIDLVQTGQGVFGIALGRILTETQGDLAVLPSERVAEEVIPEDMLAARRVAKRSAV